MEMKAARLKLGVIFGGRSGEHEVSLMSAGSVLDSIDREKYEITEIGITHTGEWLTGTNVLQSFIAREMDNLEPVTMLPNPNFKGLYRLKAADHPVIELDVVFPVLHGTFGEDGTLQGLFELAEIPYVGPSVAGAVVGMDKGIFKDVMIANQIRVAESRVFTRKHLEENYQGVIQLAELVSDYPLFVKPANLGSSVGVSKCKNASDLYEGLMEAARYDRRIIVERAIDAREIEISVLGNDEPIASVPGEILPRAEFYSYDAKYHDKSSTLIIPAELSVETALEMRQTAVRAYKAIDCSGMARVDFLLDRATDEYYLNELNTIPGFTQISMYPKLWEASGLPYPDLIDRLIELAFERWKETQKTERRYTRER